MRGVLFILFMLVPFIGTTDLYAQIKSTPSSTDSISIMNRRIISDKLDVNSPIGLDSMLHYQYYYGVEADATSGYRVQIYFGAGVGARAEAATVRSEFLKLFPNIETYLIYQAPDFKVRVGDFRNKSDALRIKKEIENRYLDAFIVSDMISFPKL